MNEFDQIAQSLYLNPQISVGTVKEALRSVSLQLPLQIAVGKPQSSQRLIRSQKREGKYFWAPHPGLVYVLWNEENSTHKRNLLPEWVLGEVFVCNKPEQFIKLLLDAIVSFRQLELERVWTHQPQKLTFTTELDTRRLALRQIQLELINSPIPQSKEWQTALSLWLDIVLLRHREHLHTVRRKLLEFASLLTCELDKNNYVGNQYALLQRCIQQTYSLTELRSGFPKWLVQLIEKLPDQKLQNRENLSPLCQQSIEWFEEHYQQPIFPAHCAAAIPISTSYLSRLFKKEVGCTPTEYLQKLRIEKARQYLQEDRYQISAIAALSGFGSVEHFYRVFQKHTGLTPAAYRRNTQK